MGEHSDDHDIDHGVPKDDHGNVIPPLTANKKKDPEDAFA